MAGTPEQGLARWLKVQCDKKAVFNKRIETTTGLGFPDLVLGKNGRVVFVELKALSGDKVSIRAAQGAWHAEAAWHGIPVYVFNRDPDTHRLRVWKAPAKLAPGTAIARAIIDEPYFDGTPDLFVEKMEIIFGFR